MRYGNHTLKESTFGKILTWNNPDGLRTGGHEHVDRTKTIPDTDPDVQAVAEAIAEGRAVDPELAKRIHERAIRIREQVYRKHGLVDIGVPAIRELRGELPEP